MLCLVCGKYFNEKRLLKELFRTKEYHVCPDCFKENPIKVEFSNIPLDKHTLEIVSIFDSNNHINYVGFTEEYSSIYENVIRMKQKEQVIMCDSFTLDEEILNEYNYISNNLDKDIVIVTNIFK
jgi:hypothetical protein